MLLTEKQGDDVAVTYLYIFFLFRRVITALAGSNKLDMPEGFDLFGNFIPQNIA
jgi:hypothetical protein